MKKYIIYAMVYPLKRTLLESILVTKCYDIENSFRWVKTPERYNFWDWVDIFKEEADFPYRLSKRRHRHFSYTEAPKTLNQITNMISKNAI